MTTPEECARATLDIVPDLMRTIRSGLRRLNLPDLTVPQFRILNFIGHNPQASLTDLADHIGLTLPTLSKMVDALVVRQLVTRETCIEDRRRVLLGLTPSGAAQLKAAIDSMQARMAEQLAVLSPEERGQVVNALSTLQTTFSRARAIIER
jgi:DNA-binding MarR family transcriptional regulator